MEMRNLDDIATLMTVVQQGSLSAAAKNLGLTRSAVGKRIARLEERLQVRLLQRNTRNLSLTEEGQLFAERCAAALEELEFAEQLLAQRHAQPSGRLKISLPVELGRLYFNRLLPAYLARYPKVELDVSLTDRYVDLIGESVDLAVRIGALNHDSSLLARPLGEQRMFLCASPDYLKRHGTPQSLSDLAQHNCLHYRSEGRPLAWHFQAGGTMQQFVGKGNFHADSGEMLAQAALVGVGLVQLPHYLVQSHLDSGNLIALLPENQSAGVPIQMLYPSRKQLSPKIRSFVDFVLGNVMTSDSLKKVEIPKQVRAVTQVSS